ncbi:MAG TPA: TraR/DksA C4-type zinc finger protein [Chloroflexota bacterium]|nr:TraR/DksA C4-type zinc finger protein [Chloroflexota bacterium]
MPTLNGDPYATVREMLARERSAVLTRMEVITQDALSFEPESDGISASGHESEGALMRMLQNRLGDIDLALARLADGSYGVCADCSSDIPPRRLEALPFATLCVSCQSVADKRGVARRV